MKKAFKIIVIIAVLFFAAFGQNSGSASDKKLKILRNQLQALKAENERLQKSLTSTSQKSDAQTRQIESLQSKISQAAEAIESRKNHRRS